MVRKKLKNRRKRILMAYAARFVAMFAVTVVLLLIACGFLYIIIEHICGKDVVYGSVANPVIESVNTVETLNDVAISERITTVANGKVVVLDAGHGGKDDGTSWGDTKEKDVVLELAEQLKSELEQRGVTVIMTRSDDTYLSLEERTRIANMENADLFLSIHIDWYEDDSSIHGLTCHYMQGSQDGKKYASALTESVQEAGIVSVRKETASDFYVLRNTQMPALLIETGYFSNSQDRNNLTNAEFQKELTRCIADGVSELLGDM